MRPSPATIAPAAVEIRRVEEDRDMATQVEPPELVSAGRASIWSKWYFTRGAFTILTAPLFLFLIYAIITSALGAAIQGIALIRVSYAVLGIVGPLFFIAGGWIPLILPPVLYYSLLKNLPGLWIRVDASRMAKIGWSIAVVIALPLAAHLVFEGVAWGIGWIADRDPCAAFDAGVTGSIPPTNCR